MSVEAPNLDDRRFQDLVDDALRLAGERLPEWSPSRPTDPGVVLIEAFAWMTDQLLYRISSPRPSLFEIPRTHRRQTDPTDKRSHRDLILDSG